MLADVTRILLCAEGDRQSQGCRTALVPLLLAISLWRDNNHGFVAAATMPAYFGRDPTLQIRRHSGFPAGEDTKQFRQRRVRLGAARRGSWSTTPRGLLAISM
jgi:hypothetical protein